MTKIWIASFDIGKKNFSFYIEEFDLCNIQKITKINEKDRYNIDGTITENFLSVFNSLCNEGKSILLENHDITNNCDNSYLDTKVFHNMNNLLDKYQDFWDKCNIFIIEKQMSFGKIHNTMALKLGQHCFSYFSIHYGETKEIIEFPAYHKTQILGAIKDTIKKNNGTIKYKCVDKPTRKKWCINKTLEILNNRNDIININCINKVKKKDDLCDVICQAQAYKILNFY